MKDEILQELEKIKTDFNNLLQQQLIDQINALNNLTYNQFLHQVKAMEDRVLRDEQSVIRKKVELKTLSEVSEQKDENGKAKFSNEKAREAEKIRLLEENSGYMDLVKTLDDLDSKINYNELLSGLYRAQKENLRIYLRCKNEN